MINPISFLRATPFKSIDTWCQNLRQSQDFFCCSLDTTDFFLFIGYNRSRHTLFAALLDAHPHVVVANDLNILKQWITWNIWLEEVFYLRADLSQITQWCDVRPSRSVGKRGPSTISLQREGSVASTDQWWCTGIVFIYLYDITWTQRALYLVKNLWIFNCVSTENWNIFPSGKMAPHGVISRC